MEEIRTTTSEIEDLVTLLLVQKESLEEGQEVDTSKWFISKTLTTIKQLNKKLDIIIGSKESKTLEKLDKEVCENKRPILDQTVKLGLSILQTCTSLETRPTSFNFVVETKEK